MRDDTVMETERTRLRPWRPEDADRMQAEYAISRWAERSAGADCSGVWAVERKGDGVVAGTQLLVPLQGAEIGWHCHPDSWGQGLAP